MYEKIEYTMRIVVEDERLFINGNFISDHCYTPEDIGNAVFSYYDNEQKGIDYIHIPLKRVSDYTEARKLDKADRKRMLLDITLSVGTEEGYPVILIARKSICDINTSANIGYQLARAIEKWLSGEVAWDYGINWLEIIEEQQRCVVEYNGYVGVIKPYFITTPFDKWCFRGRDSVEFNTGHEVRSEEQAKEYFIECIKSGKKLIWWRPIDNS